MTNEMIERVAAAIEQGVCGKCGKPAVGGTTWLECENDGCYWESANSIQQARAAIEAMREPTEEMLEYGSLNFTKDDTPMDCWQAMIEAALAERG